MAHNGPRLLAKIVSDPDNVAHRLAYADWLEKNGASALAGFIRARCALDGHVPDAEVYPTLVERVLESLAGQRKPTFELPAGFSSGCWWSSTEAWWSDSYDLLEGGLLSFVKAEDGDAETLVAGVADLVRNTPVRGIEFKRNCFEHLPVVLSSPAGRQLRRIELDGSAPEGTSVSPIQAVATSPAAPALTRLEIGHALYPLNDGDAAALAEASFDHLARLDVPFNNCSPTGLGRLQDAMWFRQLRRLLIGFNPECARDGARRLGGMPALHTLSLQWPDASVLHGLAEAEQLPDLRRLYMSPADLRDDFWMALGRLKAPRLIELCISKYNCKLGKADLKALAATSIFDGLRVLTFDSIRLTHTALDSVAASPCAKNLRILRLQNAAFRSLARSTLAQSGAFPALTTLVLYSPFTSGVPSHQVTTNLSA